MPAPEDITRSRARRDAALAAAIAAETRARQLEGAIARAERAGRGDDVRRLQAERTAAARSAQAARTEHDRFAAGALDGLVGWLEQTPEQVLAACPDAFPFVLLPVRIETKFARSGERAELRVRFFPDQVSVASPLTPVTDTERALGEDYWRARADARGRPDDDRLRDVLEGAWNALAVHTGAYRSGYVIRATAPENPDAASADLRFRDPAQPDTPPIPRADLLPDRFVVLTYAAVEGVLRQVDRAVGAAIPDDLAVGPDPSQPNSWVDRDDATGRLIIPDALRWMVDFDAAVAVGMAIRIPLTAPHDRTGYDRVLAVGVRTSTPAIEGPAAIEALLSKHRYSDGCAIVRAGTPTNNTDSALSGWRSSEDGKELFAIEDAPPDLTPGDGPLGIADGLRLRDLFGLSEEFARRLPATKATDISEALAMNRAAAPGTIDEFVGEFLKGLISPATRDDLHRFFVSWVSGRGHFPALQIGRQPYGIVLTSAWQRWRPLPPSAPFAPASDISARLFTFISQHRPNWEALARQAPHAAQTGGDPFQRLLGIVGLLASSSEYVSRKAVSDEYVRQRLQFGGADARAIQAWFNEFLAPRNQSLAAMNFPPVSGPTDPLLAFIVFMRDTHDWRLPLVDRDPGTPLSEANPVAPYDGVHNYLHWLTQASRDDIRSQRFIGPDGTAVPQPAALLYVLLRHAYLSALESGTLGTATLHGAAFFDVIERDPLIANIGSEQHILRRDYLEVDASRLGLGRVATPLADWTLASARSVAGEKPAPVRRVAEVHDAIGALANLPTARLERLLAEHIDLCSYRLDAWVTGLYAERLSLLHARTETRGMHLGAFGWVENLRPAGEARQRVNREDLPQALRGPAEGDVFEDNRNGGYIHAPSLLQATTAAVLRNGYLSHASSSQPQTFAVNLSSRRMRAANALMQGVRNGQPIAALLGYQFERGLHEGHPGVELDQFIGVLRDQFPLISGRLTEVPPGTSAEVVEARNVVDGLSLVEATKARSYPYAIGGLPAAGTPSAGAIVSEVDRLHDALDAVSDLLLSESVHQAVQGNFARTQATLQALTAPEAPPEPEIIRTPRSGRVFTFRTVLALDANATTGWSATLSARGRANPHLNHWLSQHLPLPGSIRWTVHDGTSAPVLQSMAELSLEPIDLVLMSGDQLGNQSGELERMLISRYRWRNGVPDDRATVTGPAGGPADPDPATVVRFDFGDAGTDGLGLAVLYPVLARMRRLIAQARPAHAGDWRRAADSQKLVTPDPEGSASGDPRLDNFKDLTERLDRAASDLDTINSELKNALAAAAPLRAALAADPAALNDPAWPTILDAVRDRLFALAACGRPEALPLGGLAISLTVIDDLLRQGQAIASATDGQLADAAELRGTVFTDPLPADEASRNREITRRNQILLQKYSEAAKSLLGPQFRVVPLFRLHADQSNEVQQALAGPPVGSAAAVEEWLHSAARVRPRMADMTWTMAATRWIERPIADPAVIQLPHQSGAPWIGGEFPAGPPQGEWLSVCVLNPTAATEPLKAGLLLDDWTETVPAERETTGVAFNFNRPNAVAPQAVLVAVPPELRGQWSWDDLVGAIHEALDLAKLRAVEPDALIGRATATAANGAYFQALPALLTEFSEGRLAVTDLVAHVATALAQTRP